MKIGIDSYCFHRFFGEVYPQQKPPPFSMTMEDFLDLAKELDVDGVSLESCFFPSHDAGFLADLKARLDDYGFDRVYAWGHPDGLERGQNAGAYDDMIASIDRAVAIGADTMRVVASSLMFRHEPHQPQIEALVAQFKQAVPVAEAAGVKLAVENHIDFTADEMVQMIEAVGSPNFGINFDTGNFLRLLDDPLKGMDKLAKYTYATHIKDLKVNQQAAPDDWYFFSSTPVGDGLVDNQALAQKLKDVGYTGFLAVETDFLHPDYDDEHRAIRQSVANLKEIAARLH
ncbi:MAG TPA: sugar phosphate isomerase/epimerase family protein [Trueperaceae bacterium]|nr:sugar phosphate isomerase/epimerase family protein [Trueperaceae bacterium]